MCWGLSVMSFGGISPMRQQQKLRAFVLIGAGVFLTFFLGLLFIFLNADSKASETKPVQQVEAKIEMQEVLIPNQTIEAGQKLEPGMFRKESKSKAGLPISTIRDLEEIKGFYSRSVLSADMPFVRDVITNVQPTNQVTSKIPEGYRAVTIPVDAKTGVEGWSRAGARVDISWVTVVNGKEVLATIVQNAEVLSAGQSLQGSLKAAEGSMNIPGTVTLLVTSRDAQKIQLASTRGVLSLSLRGDSDPGKGGSGGGSITIDDILGVSRDNSRIDQPSEGGVRIKGPDGKYEELVLVRGKLEPKKQQ